MLAELTIEEATLPELPSLARFISEVFLASPLFQGVDEARYAADVILTALQQATVFVVRSSGEIMGAAALSSPQRHSPCEHIRRHPSLGFLTVRPEARGQGVGGLLCEAVEAYAKGRGYPLLLVSATTRGGCLPRYYEQMGYIYLEQFHWPSAPSPSWIMAKALTLS